MSARVFISCGQATPEERGAAKALEGWFRGEGFEPYVAITTQTLEDVNSGIIEELRRADYYVFVDFRRERLVKGFWDFWNPRNRAYRGSLFTNQEVAIAHLLKFEKVIFLQQEGVELNGLMKYMASNAERFATPANVPAAVERLVAAQRWRPSYTRHLTLGESRLSEPIRFGDHTGARLVRTFFVDVHNNREDLHAANVEARIERIIRPDGTLQTGLDTTRIKTTGQPGFTRTIRPGKHGAWDFFSIAMEEPATVYLNSELDLHPRAPIISAPGEYTIVYEVFAERFRVLRFGIHLLVANDPQKTTAVGVPALA